MDFGEDESNQSWCTTLKRVRDARYIFLEGEHWKQWKALGGFDVTQRCRHLAFAFKSNSILESVELSHDFLEPLSVEDQCILLVNILDHSTLMSLKLGGNPERSSKRLKRISAIKAIHPQALTAALPVAHASLNKIIIKHMTFSKSSEALKLGVALESKRDTITSLVFGELTCSFKTANPQEGSLDHLLMSLAQMHQASWLELNGVLSSTKGQLLVGHRALQFLLQRQVQSSGRNHVILRGLGLNNSHCSTISNALGMGSPRIWHLNLMENPEINETGLTSLLGLLNREHCLLAELWVDSRSWRDKYELVIRMNQFGRKDALSNGGYESREKWGAWMARASHNENDSFALSAVFYTLLETPHFVKAA